MKKLLTLTTLGAILTAPATAVQKCVAINPGNMGQSIGGGSASGTADWHLQFDGVDIEGIAVCSSGYNTIGRLVDSLTYSSSNVSDNRFCYGRIVTPAVSKWYVAKSFSSALECTNGCSVAAANFIDNNIDSGLYDALFESLSD